MKTETYTGKFFLIQGINVESGAVDLLAVAFGPDEAVEFCVTATQNDSLEYHAYRVVEGGDFASSAASPTHASTAATN